MPGILNKGLLDVVLRMVEKPEIVGAAARTPSANGGADYEVPREALPACVRQ
jgi:hypothetical protein